MASLIFAAGFLTYNKVKDKKEQRREKKKKVHEEWYEDLQKEHSRGVEEREKAQAQAQAQSPQKTESSKSPFEDIEDEKTKTGRRNSSDSHRSGDGPDKWVDDVVKERRRSMGVTG